jgi:hypothetical protein
MVLSLEKDRRGTHLRLRKVASLARRALRPITTAALLSFCAAASGQMVIQDATQLWAPSFRSASPADANNTTWFGWQGNLDADPFDNNGFDGTTNNELIDNPAVLIGVGGRDGTLNQVGTADILASSNNIFAGDFISNAAIEEHLTLQIPVNGVVGTGFTTIILQTRGAITGDGFTLFPIPGAIAGTAPTIATGINAAGQLQLWAKYEIPGNLDFYTVDIHIPAEAGANPVSIQQLIVDTHWSASGYAPDSALSVPEPGLSALLASGAVLGLVRRQTGRRS